MVLSIPRRTGNGIRTSRNVLQTFTNQRLSENGSRRRTITSDIFVLEATS
jgi:hypothetical protein